MKGITPRRYTVLFLGTGLLLCAVVGILNTVVDPYGNLGLNRVGVFLGAEREYKPVQIRQYPHDAILLGNSMVGVVNPNGLRAPWRFYNASMAGARAEEMRCFVERYVHEEKLVVLAMDFGMFRQAEGVDLKNPLPDSSLGNVLRRIFSLKTAEYSISALLRSWKGDLPGYRSNGASWNDSEKRESINRGMKDFQYGSVPVEAARYYANYVYDPRRMDEIKELKNILDKRGIKYLVYINPRHEKITAALEGSQAYPQYQEWRKEMGEVFPNLVDLSGPEYADPKFYYRFDPGHTTPEASLQILEKVLQKTNR